MTTTSAPVNASAKSAQSDAVREYRCGWNTTIDAPGERPPRAVAIAAATSAGQVRVVVDERDAVALAAELEAAGDAAEAAQRARDRRRSRRRAPAPSRPRRWRSSPPSPRSARPARRAGAPSRDEREAAAVGVAAVVDDAGSRRRACSPYVRTAGRRRGDRGADSASSMPHTTGPGTASTKRSNACDERVEPAVVIEVVGLDVRDDRGRRARCAGTCRRSRRPRRRATSPSPYAAFVPTSLSSPPMRKLGLPARLAQDQREHRRRRRLPVRTGDRDRVGASRRSRRAPGAVQHRGCRAASRAATSSGFPSGTAVEYTTASASSGTCSRPVADAHVDAGRAQPVEDRRVLDVGAAHAMAHAGEQQRDRAHPDAGDADDVHGARRREVERRDRRRSASLIGVTPSGRRAMLLDRSASTGRGVGTREPTGAPLAICVEPLRVGEQSVTTRVEARRVALVVGARRPPRRLPRASPRSGPGGRSAHRAAARAPPATRPR